MASACINCGRLRTPDLIQARDSARLHYGEQAAREHWLSWLRHPGLVWRQGREFFANTGSQVEPVAARVVALC